MFCFALCTPVLRMRSDMSYSVYLVHGPLIQTLILLGLFHDTLLFLVIVVCCVLALAYVAERLVERPGNEFGRRLSRRMITTYASDTQRRVTQAPVDRVIVLNDFCHVQGGASKVAIDEAVALAEAGVDVTFLGAVGPICEALRDAPLRVVCLDQPQLLDVARHPGVALRGMYNRAASAAMLELIARQDPRTCAIHLHGYTKALTATPALVARRAGFRHYLHAA